MANDEIRRIDSEHNVEQRSMTQAALQAAVGGVSAGVAGALTNSAVNALRKPKDEQPQQPKKD